MAARRWAFLIAGLILAFFGVVFALQGANVIKGSSVMSGNSTYIYVGGALAVIGLVLMATGAMSKPKASGNV